MDHIATSSLYTYIRSIRVCF